MVREMVQWLPEVIIWIKSSILLIESFSINISETWLKNIAYTQENAYKNVICTLAAILFRPPCVNR